MRFDQSSELGYIQSKTQYIANEPEIGRNIYILKVIKVLAWGRPDCEMADCSTQLPIGALTWSYHFFNNNKSKGRY